MEPGPGITRGKTKSTCLQQCVITEVVVAAAAVAAAMTVEEQA